MIPHMITSPPSPESNVLTRVWRWFVYDAVEAEAMCLCACHLGGVGHCALCVCAVCPGCGLWIQAGKMAEHRQQCGEEKGTWKRAAQPPKAA